MWSECEVVTERQKFRTKFWFLIVLLLYLKKIITMKNKKSKSIKEIKKQISQSLNENQLMKVVGGDLASGVKRF